MALKVSRSRWLSLSVSRTTRGPTVDVRVAQPLLDPDAEVKPAGWQREG